MMQVLIHSLSDILKSKVQLFSGRQGISIKFRGVSRIHEFYNEIDLAILDFDAPEVDWFGWLKKFDVFECKPKIVIYSSNEEDKMSLSHKSVYAFTREFPQLGVEATHVLRGTPKSTDTRCRKCRKKK